MILQVSNVNVHCSFPPIQSFLPRRQIKTLTTVLHWVETNFGNRKKKKTLGIRYSSQFRLSIQFVSGLALLSLLLALGSLKNYLL